MKIIKSAILLTTLITTLGIYAQNYKPNAKVYCEMDMKRLLKDTGIDFNKPTTISKEIFHKMHSKICLKNQDDFKFSIITSGATSKQIGKCEKGLYKDPSYQHVKFCIEDELGKDLD